jgi:hypothetical protein
MELHSGKLELSDTVADGHDVKNRGLAVTMIFPVK